MRLTTVSQRLALLAMLGTPMAACSKKEDVPAPVERAADNAADKAVEAAKPLDAKTEEKVVEAVKAVDSALATGAGNYSLLKGNLLETLPANVMAVAGTSNLVELVNAFADITRKAGTPVPADPIAMAQAQLEGAFAVKLDWLDLTKPVRLAVPDPKVHRDGYILILTVKSGAAFDPAKLPGAQPDAEGHLAKIVFQGQTVYLDREGDLLIVTTAANLKTALGDFIKTLSAWTPGAPLVIDSSLANLTTTFGAEVAEARKMADELANSSGEDAQSLKDGVDLIFTFLSQVERGSILIDPRGDHARFQFGFKAREGSEIAKYADQLKGKTSAFINNIPESAWLGVAGHSPKDDSALSEKYFLSAFENEELLGKWTAPEREVLRTHYRSLIEQGGTDSALWIDTTAKGTHSVSAIANAEDGQKLVATTLALSEFLISKAIAHQRTTNPELPADLNFKSLVALVNEAPDAPLKVEIVEKAGKEGSNVYGTILKPNWVALDGAGDITHVRSLFGEEISGALYGHGKLMTAAFGDNAVENALALYAAGAASAPKSVLATQLNDYSSVGFLFPVRLTKALEKVVPEVAAKKDKLRKFRTFLSPSVLLVAIAPTSSNSACRPT